MPVETLSSAPCAALRSARASAPNDAGRPAGAFVAMSADSLTSRHSRCTKRDAPCPPSTLQITARSGGEADSMNQRAPSAPYAAVLATASTVLRYAVDIFSIGPVEA